jgi:NAD(P)-dependent dehydrogenase (short-subunit alcohol dehydrogenase family)
VFLLDLNGGALAHVVAEVAALGGEAIAHVADLSDPAQTAAAAQAAVARWGGVDVVVNNAGIAYFGPTHDMRIEQWERLMGVNLMAPIRLIHALLPSLREQPQGHILNVASITGLVPKRRIAAYQTSKYGLVGLSQSLRAEYSPYGIGVTALCCGFVRTELLATAAREGMKAGGREPAKWYTVSPEYVARVAVRAIRRNRGVVVVPVIARVFWWVQRLSPAILDLHGHLVHWRAIRRRKRKEARGRKTVVRAGGNSSAGES